jgi:hypothetical protein
VQLGAYYTVPFFHPPFFPFFSFPFHFGEMEWKLKKWRPYSTETLAFLTGFKKWKMEMESGPKIERCNTRLSPNNFR